MCVRFGWVKLFFKMRNVGYVCCWCGISRLMLCKWVWCYEREGVDGLVDKFCCLKILVNIKIILYIEIKIILLCIDCKFGCKCIVNEMLCLYDVFILVLIV